MSADDIIFLVQEDNQTKLLNLTQSRLLEKKYISREDAISALQKQGLVKAIPEMETLWIVPFNKQ